MKRTNRLQDIFKKIVLLMIVVLGASGCGRPYTRTRVVHHHPHGKVVVIHKGHVHTARCGHYRYNARWYYMKGHAHGKHCGHVRVNGIWIIKV
ncbi:MAG: hypothetical protein ACE5G2_04850 [Candidatus Krumholzibacteriia bacterium]